MKRLQIGRDVKKIQCENCKHFAWHGKLHEPVPGPDRLYHHPACYKVRSVRVS